MEKIYIEVKDMELFVLGKYRTLVVKIYGELDHHKADSVRKAIDREIKRCGVINIAFDFSNVTFMDSSGIGVIMGRYKIAKSLGGSTVIYGANESVQRIIDMSGITNIVTVSDSLENGLKEAAANV